MPQHTSWDLWSAEDDAKLIRWAGRKPDHVIAHLLGRTRSAVQQRASKKEISLCVGRTWEPVKQHEITKAAEILLKHIDFYGGKTSAAREMGVTYPRFQLLIKYAKKQGYL